MKATQTNWRAPRGVALIACALAALALAGCMASRKVAVKPSEIRRALDADQSTLVAAYNAQARAVHSLNATVQMTPVAGSAYSGVIQEYHQVGGFILMARPAMIRVIGQAPVVAKNIFDMVSDGETFRIFIPSKDQFLVGSTKLERAATNPIENLRPQHILEAFFWPELPAGAPVLFEQAEAPPDHYYVLTLLRGGAGNLEIDRKIWFDRANLHISRVEVFGPAGRLDADITYSDWRGSDAAGGAANVSFARQIAIRRPQQDYRIAIAITKLTLNTEITADRFALAQPPGSRLVRVGQEQAQP